MTRPVAERRRHENRMVRRAIVVAVAAHLVVFAVVGWTRVGPEWSPGEESLRLTENSWVGSRVDVAFGPPKIVQGDGTLLHEPPSRTLQTIRILRMPPICLDREIPPSAPGYGEVRLTVNATGHIEQAELERSTGDSCWDRVARRVSGDLHYHWLPGERFQAPLEVLQPVTVGVSASR